MMVIASLPQADEAIWRWGGLCYRLSLPHQIASPFKRRARNDEIGCYRKAHELLSNLIDSTHRLDQSYAIIFLEEVRILEPLEIARKAVAAASDKQAMDIVLLDTRELCSFADYFVLCSGDSDRQIEAIRDEVGQVLKKEGVIRHHEEGTIGSGWLLLDYHTVIVHIFAPVQRAYYQLDKLWQQAPALVRIQ